ncbi:hypothetical protein MPTK1_4g00840 [Marchantia polymorpha subsp. ruderalis]|uniref:Uncharacterized protein n=2 Tax=Marchantia polymorpha TaxID=3197 RepID=A0AAF6B4Z8_MARPO|nr:hypothetical protein MARPO_0066s0059 [Marchantia polymorpha]BBN07082.1 hypothetical protein Mp_4g00840 [Marchantia polymorpha subsp. ruderalis]|eukprot:PTQ36102.1 hypothetical protein MARPO_0066s0059 [Marchantia polymorpha]
MFFTVLRWTLPSNRFFKPREERVPGLKILVSCNTGMAGAGSSSRLQPFQVSSPGRLENPERLLHESHSAPTG